MANDEKDDPRAKRKLWVWAIALPVLYVLSVGPSDWIFNHPRTATLAGRRHAETFVYWFYAPLRWADKRVPPFHSALEWYHGLFQRPIKIVRP